MSLYSPFGVAAHQRNAAALDSLVILLATITFLFWIAGSLFLAFFPAANPTGLSNSGVQASSAASNDDSAADKTGAAASNTDRPNSLTLTDTNDESGLDANTADVNVTDIKTTVHLMGSAHKSSNDFETAADANAIQQSQEVDRLKNELASLKLEFDRYKETAASLNPSGAQPNLQDDRSKQLAAELESVRNELTSAKRILESQRTEHQSQLAEINSGNAGFSETIELLKDKNRELNAELTIQRNLLEQLKSKQVATDLADSAIDSPAPVPNALPAPLFRKWQGKNGRVVEMAFIRRDASGQYIFIGKDNQLFSVPPSRLSDADLKLVESATK